MAIVVNLFAGPGAGKSTLAAGIFFELKMAGVNCELVREYAKKKVWEGNNEVFENQAYIFGKQSYETQYVAKNVDVVITDSPIMLSALYNKSAVLGKGFNTTVFHVFNQYDNMNYFIDRVKIYNPAGRFQNEAEAMEKDKETLKMLTDYKIPYAYCSGDRSGLYQITNDILIKLNKSPIYLYTTSSTYGNQFIISDYNMSIASKDAEDDEV